MQLIRLKILTVFFGVLAPLYLANNLCQIPQGTTRMGASARQRRKRYYGASAPPCLSHFISIPGVSFRSNLMASSWASYLLHYLVTFTSFAQDYERAGAPESKQFLLFSKLLHCCCSCWFCYCCCTNLHDLWLCIASQTNQVTQLTSQTQTEPKPSSRRNVLREYLNGISFATLFSVNAMENA